jgi:hypothetical protein
MTESYRGVVQLLGGKSVLFRVRKRSPYTSWSAYWRGKESQQWREFNTGTDDLTKAIAIAEGCVREDYGAIKVPDPEVDLARLTPWERLVWGAMVAAKLDVLQEFKAAGLTDILGTIRDVAEDFGVPTVAGVVPPALRKPFAELLNKWANRDEQSKPEAPHESS